MINTDDVQRIVAAARGLSPAEASYLEDDFVMNLFETVLDYQMHTTAVIRALEHFKEHRWDDVRALNDLEDLFAEYADDQMGNTALAQMSSHSFRTSRRADDHGQVFRSLHHDDDIHYNFHPDRYGDAMGLTGRK